MNTTTLRRGLLDYLKVFTPKTPDEVRLLAKYRAAINGVTDQKRPKSKGEKR